MRAILTFLLICSSAAHAVHAAEKAKHVVVVVWDGMRPDFVSEINTPTLHALASRGVFFKSNHCVYLSSTEVNGTALATGAYPQRSGIIANNEFRPNVDARRAVATQGPETIRKSDAQEKYLNVPTLAETLQGHGLHTAVAGSKGVALLHDRADRGDDASNPVLFDSSTLPAAMMSRLTNALGPLPETGGPTKTNRDTWVTRALIGPMWEKGVPAFSLLWLAEPDNSQHNSAPGSARSLASIRNSDRALAMVVEALKQKGVYDTTDIFVVSDHGFSTIVRAINVVTRLRENGFNAAREFAVQPAKGDVLVVGSGGSALLYVAEHDEATIGRLVRFLQTEDYVGAIFTRRAGRGTFALEDALIDSKHAPAVVFSFRWSDATNRYGIAGQVFADTTTNPWTNPDNLTGTHVSLSRFDLNNTLIAAGPDFRRGLVSETPSGNVDVTPTILHILGVKPAGQLDGRVLFEALDITSSKPPEIRRRELQARAKLPSGEWTQRLSISEVNGVRYLEAGDGQFTAARAGTDPLP